MRTAYCPKSHTELASVTVGTPYGHVAGHQYADVDVVVSHRPGVELTRCHVVESWGSAHGRDEEHGRREVIGRGRGVEGACSDAIHRGREAGIDGERLQQAVSQAMDAALQAVEYAADAEPTITHYTCGTPRCVRGECGVKHATLEAAQRCCDRDQGGYSDRSPVAVYSDGSRGTPDAE